MKNIFSTVIILSLLGISFYFNSWYGIATTLLSLTVYLTVFYILHIIWKIITRKNILHIYDFIKWFFYKISLFIVIIGCILGGLGYYFNEVSPAPMPELTISNGEKTVVFQAMSHIGTQDFYNQIKENLTSAKKTGYVYFFEGVKPGTPQNMEDFNKAIGIKFSPDLYENFSKLYGVTNQDNRIYYNLENDLDFNVDLSIDQIMELYNEKPRITKTIQMPIDASETIVETLTSLNERELKILIYVNQAILNFIIASDETQELITNNFGNKELFDVILNKRNEVLANEIIESEYNKIYTTYGLLHFKGVLELLKQNDNKWEITNTENLYPIQ